MSLLFVRAFDPEHHFGYAFSGVDIGALANA